MSGPLGSQQWMYSTGFYPYEIGQSLRFNDDDSAYLSRTPASNGNRKTFTFSFWTKLSNSTYEPVFGSRGSPTVTRFEIGFYLGKLFIQNNNGSSWNLDMTSSALFRDFSAWYHIVFAVDTTQATSSDRVKLYVNGVNQSFSITTSPSLNLDLDCMITTATSYVGTDGGGVQYYDGYMSDYYFIDGQALDPTSFGEFKSGVWIPKSYSGSYGTNGFYLDFGNSGSLGADSSGNGNNWTPNNLAATDQVIDSPTNNFCTLNPLSVGTNCSPTPMTLSEGNLKGYFDRSSSGGTWAIGTSQIPNSGKWYAEFVITSFSAGLPSFGISDVIQNSSITSPQNTRSYNANNGYKLSFNASGSVVVNTAYGAAYTTGDIIGIAVDMDAGEIEFYKNNSSQGVAFTDLITSGINWTFSIGGTGGNSSTSLANFGQDSSFAGNKTRQGNTDARGIGDFYYAPPAGYLALCTANLPDPAIDPAQDDVPEDYFNTVLYAGNSSTQAITNVGFQPDLNWIKCRNSTAEHFLHDSVRGKDAVSGNYYYLISSLTAAEAVQSDNDGVNSFDSDGFTLGYTNSTSWNQSGSTYVAWNWLADNTSGSTNTDGTITSTVSANQKAGFSIVSYTGSTGNYTFGHGLSVAPEIVLIKNRSASANWFVITDATGSWNYGHLNLTDALLSAAQTANSTVVNLNNNVYNWYNTNGDNYIAYCFHSVEGYSKFGSYTGNGSTDGPFVYTGFRPAFVMAKNTDAASQWIMFDAERDIDNPTQARLRANASNTEAAQTVFDFLSNGFKLRATGTDLNDSGNNYIYMAFAEMPFKYSNAR
jgi:hypothetical protein